MWGGGGGSGKECFCACTIRGKWSGHDSHEGLAIVIVGFLLVIDQKCMSIHNPVSHSRLTSVKWFLFGLQSKLEYNQLLTVIQDSNIHILARLEHNTGILDQPLATYPGQAHVA